MHIEGLAKNKSMDQMDQKDLEMTDTMGGSNTKKYDGVNADTTTLSCIVGAQDEDMYGESQVQEAKFVMILSLSQEGILEMINANDGLLENVIEPGVSRYACIFVCMHICMYVHS